MGAVYATFLPLQGFNLGNGHLPLGRRMSSNRGARLATEDDTYEHQMDIESDQISLLLWQELFAFATSEAPCTRMLRRTTLITNQNSICGQRRQSNYDGPEERTEPADARSAAQLR